MTTYIFFILGFFILIKGADILINGSVSVAKKFKISSIVIGLTIIAFGTSMPELIVNIFANAQGNTEIVIGNILGSNIVNILFILGISAVIYPITANKNTVLKEIPFSLLAIVVLGIMANDIIIDGQIFSIVTRIDGLILISFFIIFLYYIFGITKSVEDIVGKDEIKVFSYSKAVFYIILGIVGLIVGGKWIVDGAVEIARFFNISESLIGLTIVAIGTSLPELATSAVAAYKKQSDIAIGNIVGSNIFNIFWVLGVSAIIRPLPFNDSLNKDIAMTIFASVILFLMMFIGKKRIIKRWQGIFMIIVYIGYIVFLVWSK